MSTSSPIFLGSSIILFSSFLGHPVLLFITQFSQNRAARFSDIFYLKQFKPKKMGEEVLILPNSLSFIHVRVVRLIEEIANWTESAHFMKSPSL